MINVTKVWMPDKAKFIEYVNEIYENGWITNYGPLVQKLEKKLADYLGVKNLLLVSNGTSGLEVAYRTLGLKNDVITTPFSAVATTSSIVATGLHPVFVDIDPETLTIDSKKIEESITPLTSAIIAVHIYGYPCAVEEIETIAKKHNLKVIYDAAHAFGITYKDKSILQYGDISVLSFHATKLFHTIEGGALIINDDSLVAKAQNIIKFGIENPEYVPELGINAKMNEFEAAMGLVMLDEMDEVVHERKIIHNRYVEALKDIVFFPKVTQDATQNFSYTPVLFKDEIELKKVQKALAKQDIYPRRYFYPSLDTLPYIVPKQFCPVSRDASSRVFALPLYAGLKENEQELIIKIIKTTLG
jgi:dTDP-4-amino-4,6-dideoxygalactose transaminase